jgi:hypothetical protein
LTLGGDFGGLARRYPQWRGAAIGALENATRALKRLHENLRRADEPEIVQPPVRLTWLFKVGAGAEGRRYHIPLDDIIEFKWTDGGGNPSSDSAAGFPWEPWEGAWIRRHSLGTECRSRQGEWLSLVLRSSGGRDGNGARAACLLALGREVKMEGFLPEAEALQAGVPPWGPELAQELEELPAETAA